MFTSHYKKFNPYARAVAIMAMVILVLAFGFESQRTALLIVTVFGLLMGFEYLWYRWRQARTASWAARRDAGLP